MASPTRGASSTWGTIIRKINCPVVLDASWRNAFRWILDALCAQRDLAMLAYRLMGVQRERSFLKAVHGIRYVQVTVT